VSGLLTEERVLADARATAALDDFGDPWFLEPMRKFLDSLNAEGTLSPAGVTLQHGRLVHALVNRLRLTDAVKRHPEILDEPIAVAGVIVGLPRTGSTMFHRMLANAPGVNFIRWWEVWSYAPLPDEERGNPVARRAHAARLMDDFVAAGMMAMHPFALDAPDEEIMILDQFCVGTGPEANVYVPSFAEWLSEYDHRPAYENLKLVLKFLQWQDATRAGKRWILKTPGHLPTLDALLDVFPEAVVITNHRDPLQTVPSFASMLCAIHAMSTDPRDDVRVGRHVAMRWAKFLKRYAAVRERIGPDRFIDIKYEDLIAAPLDQARPVLARLGMDMTPDVEAAMTEWLAENAREKRAAHVYTLEQFGLTVEELAADFAEYRQRFG